MLALSVVMYAVSAIHWALIMTLSSVTHGPDTDTVAGTIKILYAILYLPVINVRPRLLQRC